jgi:hypothetical protein
METLTLLLCAIFIVPLAGILVAGAFWAYVWIKEGLANVDQEEKEVIEAIKKLPKSARVSKRGGLHKGAR